MPICSANLLPSNNARCCTAVVKNDDPFTSSHKSNVVEFQYSPMYARSLTMIGHKFDTTVVFSPLASSQLEYAVSVIARKAGPSLWGRPHAPVNADSSTLNFGSPKPLPSDKSPEGFDTVCSCACEELLIVFDQY